MADTNEATITVPEMKLENVPLSSQHTVGAIYNGNLSILPFLSSEWLTLGLDTVWQIANDSAPPLQPDQSMIQLSFPNTPGMISLLQIKGIVQVECLQFQDKLLGIGVVRLIFCRRS